MSWKYQKNNITDPEQGYVMCNDYFSSLKHQMLGEHIPSQWERAAQFAANYCH